MSGARITFVPLLDELHLELCWRCKRTALAVCGIGYVGRNGTERIGEWRGCLNGCPGLPALAEKEEA